MNIDIPGATPANEPVPAVQIEPPRRAPGVALRLLYGFENSVLAAVLLGIVALPLIEIIGRRFLGEGVPDSIAWVRHLTLWVGFLGAVLAARENRHIALGFSAFLTGRWRGAVAFLATCYTALVCVFLAWASVEMVRADRESADVLGGLLPIWIVELVIPGAFALLAVRAVLAVSQRNQVRLLAVPVVVLLGIGLVFLPAASRAPLLVPGLVMVIVAALSGAPIYALLGGAAIFLFYVADTTIASIPVEAYRIASNPVLPSLPLFTLAGAVLAEGRASERLVRLFRALFCWVPGGTAVATVAVCAFFTTFTGGSGVTILALGGLMLPVLLKQGYDEKFSLGLLTAAGSLGILFPPSLVIILYGVQALTPIDRLFLAGIGPGLLLVIIVALYSGWKGRRIARDSRFDLGEGLKAIWAAKWEVMLPLVVLVSIFSGYATLVEAAALTAFYTFVVEGLIHRELGISRDFPKILAECAVMIGGIFIILACAMGLTNYLIDADIPSRGADWVQSGIESKAVFLLALNGFLLIVGCLMDIFSAIVVAVPLILPVADAFGIDRVHLGIVFLANMELGYLTPPVGMNLFVACFCFKRPLLQVYRASVPFLLILLAGVVMITYLPWLTIGLIEQLGW
ncbi:MAG: TRAP transporter large permease subunit [Acidobacteriota bacterium]